MGIKSISFDLVNESQPYYNSLQRGTNKSIILVKCTTMSRILLTSQQLTISNAIEDYHTMKLNFDLKL